MKYLSFDIEATGLNRDDLIIEYAMIPFDSKTFSFAEDLKRHYYIQCPSFEDIGASLDPWVQEHNKNLINKAHETGISLSSFKEEMTKYLELDSVQEYFQCDLMRKRDGFNPIVLFGKSLNSIDLPFLNRDLGFEFMRKYFHHQVLDLSSIVMTLIDQKRLPENCISGGKLMKHFNMGEVAHTALADAIHTAEMYFKILKEHTKN